MSDKTNNQKEDKRKYTPQELEAMRSQMIADFEKENVLLRLRAEHATLTAKIEVQQTRSLEAIITRYNMTRASKDANEAGAPAEGPINEA